MKPRFLAARLAVAALLGPFAAAAADTDYSDLWWDPGESGWGVGLQRQGDIIFLTLFLYGPDGSGTWLIASSVQPSDPWSDRWEGTLYRATGPAFSAPYDPNVQTSPVGTVAIHFAGPSNATMTYTVDGVRVSKAITRMTWREPSAAGTYYGGFTAQVAECADATRVGDYEFLGNMIVTHSNRQARATVTTGSTGLPSTCTFNAATTQAGRLGSWSGTFSCNLFIGLDGRGEDIVRVQRGGSFTLEQVTITANGFHGTLVGADQDCVFRGRFGGTRLP